MVDIVEYLGRFLQTDPIGFAAGDVNIYRYVGNDITDYIDRYGYFEGNAAVDLDGDPHAYAVLGSGKKGDDFLDNARKNGKHSNPLDPSILLFTHDKHGKPVAPVQKNGYYVSMTSYRPNGGYVNSLTVSYIALSTTQKSESGGEAKLGEGEFEVEDIKTHKTTWAVYADNRGKKANKDVEVSGATLGELNIQYTRTGGVTGCHKLRATFLGNLNLVYGPKYAM